MAKLNGNVSIEINDYNDLMKNVIRLEQVEEMYYKAMKHIIYCDIDYYLERNEYDFSKFIENENYTYNRKKEDYKADFGLKYKDFDTLCKQICSDKLENKKNN